MNNICNVNIEGCVKFMWKQLMVIMVMKEVVMMIIVMKMLEPTRSRLIAILHTNGYELLANML